MADERNMELIVVGSFPKCLPEGDGQLLFRVNEGTTSVCSVMAQRVKISAPGTGCMKRVLNCRGFNTISTKLKK